MSFRCRILRMAFMLMALGFPCFLQAQTSRNSPHLKQALQRYPAADTNRDGILTREEALSYRAKTLSGNDSRPASQASSGNRSPEKQVYKRAGANQLSLDIYFPQGHNRQTSSPVPAMVLFHGGGWSSGNPKQFEALCRYLADRGLVAISVEYRLVSQPGVALEDCLEDAKSALRWVRGNAASLGVDPRRIGAGGGSAGGHLAAATALIPKNDAPTDDKSVSPWPNALVLFNPVMGIEGQALMEEARRRKNLARGTIDDCMPLRYAGSRHAPCIMFFGTQDPLLPGAELFRTKTVQAGNRCELLTYPGQNHGFFNPRHANGKYFDLTAAETERFLRELGWIPAPFQNGN